MYSVLVINNIIFLYYPKIYIYILNNQVTEHGNTLLIPYTVKLNTGRRKITLCRNKLYSLSLSLNYIFTLFVINNIIIYYIYIKY